MNRYWIFIISGRVQGVYYRKNVADNAKKAGFSGYVKNLSNGDVEAVAMLDSDNFDKFVKILEKGSMFSSVKNIAHSECGELLSGDFEVRY